jgi:hypothetical protein
MMTGIATFTGVVSERSAMRVPATRLTATLLACLCTAGIAIGADAAGLSDSINLAAQQFEQDQERAFKPAAASIDNWRHLKHHNEAKELNDLFDRATAADRPFAAYHALSLDPMNKAARAVLTAGGAPAPFDDQGNRVPDVKAPLTSNRALIEKVANLLYPPFSEVAEIVGRKSPSVQSYWKSQASGLADLRKQLLGLAAKGEPASAYQVLAYYWPTCKEVVAYYGSVGKPVPRQRTWFPCVDRYLLDHELAGVDCLDTRIFKPNSGPEPVANSDKTVGGSTLNGASAWDFMEKLRNCRVEAMVTVKGASDLSVVDATGHGVLLAIKGKQMSLDQVEGDKRTMLAEATLDADPDMTPLSAQLEVHGRKVAALIGGAVVASGELSSEYAYARFVLHASGMNAQQLRVRFLGDLKDDGLLASKALPKPADEPWRVERLKQLDRPVSFKFDDTPVEEAVAALSQLTGVKFTFDSKAETLKNLPVTLSGKDMKLQSALEWLGRVTDITYAPTADGVALSWSK